MKKVVTFFIIIFSTSILQNCSEDLQDDVNSNKSIPAQWADLTLYTIQFTFSNTPTYTSRSLGYIGLTMYESVVHGSNIHKSLVGQVNGLAHLPIPEEDSEYNWTLSLNAGQAYIIKKLYSHAPPHIITRINELESSVYEQEIIVTDHETADRSVQYGRSIAEAIYEWSKSDGGHEGYLHNFDFDYITPQGESYWTPPLFGQSASLYPLHPHWGNNRTFIPANALLEVPVITPYSNDPKSDYYKFFLEVYIKRRSLTNEEKRIAAWWADDPTQTSSPPGHSYNLATIAITKAKADIFTAAEVYAKVGMAVGDSFICCWKCKYTYHSERPFHYIRDYIDKTYEQFWPEPPFPAFPSGHATQSAAAAMAMISVFGQHFSLIDNTHAARHPDFGNIPYRSRTFATIWDTALECAYSRFLGGIHTRQDNEAGTTQGKKIGENVIQLPWKK